MKQNYEQWHKNCALEVTSFRFKRALSNVSKNETENELPTKMTRAILPVQQSISNAICFFCDSAGVFSKQDFAGSQKQKRITYYIVLSHLIVTVKFDKQRHKWEIQNCEPNYQKETWWLGKRAIIKTVWQNWGINFPNFPTIKKIKLNTFRKVLKLLQLPRVCHLLNTIRKIVMRLHLS